MRSCSLSFARSPRVLLSGLALLILGSILFGPESLFAQVPATTVKDGSGNVVLQSNADGGLLAPGTFVGSGVAGVNDLIPATGAGTRLMWYPAKAAFRAGQVGREKDGTQWDANNIGEFSAAFGVDTQANNFAATAMGNKTTASGNGSTAMGTQTTAGPGSQAVAMGFGTTASGNGSTAMGLSTIAATNNSLTIGTFNDKNRGQDDSNPTTGPLFVVGNGSSGNRSDALVLDQQGNLTVNGISQSSDRRLKTQIEPLGSKVLRKLSKLRPVRYEFKNQQKRPSGKQIGLIAQDVRKEFPELVGKSSEDYLSLAYPNLTAVLLQGLQEQQAQIDSLKQRVHSLQEVKKDQKHLARQVAALQQSRSNALPAGWGPTALLLLMVGAGSFGSGLLWHRRG